MFYIVSEGVFLQLVFFASITPFAAAALQATAAKA